MQNSTSTDNQNMRPEGRAAVETLRDLPPVLPTTIEELAPIQQRREYADTWLFSHDNDDARHEVARHMYNERGRAEVGRTAQPIWLPWPRATERHLQQLQKDGWIVRRDSHWPVPEWLWPCGATVRDPLFAQQ